MTCPASNSWTTGATFADTTGKDSAKFTVSDAVGADQCLFVRIATYHDENVAYSTPKIARKGSLSTPSGLSVSTNISTYRATVTATNESDVPDSQLAVIFKTRKTSLVVGIIPHGSSSVTVQCPAWSASTGVAFGVYAFQGTATAKQRADGVTSYSITKNLKSTTLWDGGSVPVEPENVTASIAGAGEVLLTWDWSWEEANNAELSWSQNENAWESTDEPQSYTINNLHAASWRVSNLETGVRWYFRIRLMEETTDGTTYGPYSDPVYVDLSSAPDKPVLTLSSAVVTANSLLTATWGFVSTDGTGQAYAEICEFDGTNYGDPIAHSTTAQHLSISVDRWTTGETYQLCVRVTSASGNVSEWSDPVPVIVAEPITCEITANNLVEETITYGSESRTVLSLKSMPLTATITGAGAGGTTTLIVERAQEYRMIRPDDSAFDGFEGETIILYRQTGEDAISIGTDALLGRLDDGAAYRLIATVEDGLSQSATQTLDFEVHWTHRAGVPTVTIQAEGNAAVITPTAPASYAEGDMVDIYRLSSEAPAIVIKSGVFGETYVDPYPALGEHGGYRVVCITSNDDYITADEQPAWVDDRRELFSNAVGYIDFNGETIPLEFNATLGNNWQKDFKETVYLGGTVRGDWNPAITKRTSVSIAVTSDATEMIRAIRRLAEYAGICHVRTQDGASYAADVQVSANTGYDKGGQYEEFSLTITRVDPEGLDGVLYSEWVSE